MKSANFSWRHYLGQHRTDAICFLVFILLACFLHIYHEPWYDEIQAWNIAKTASWYDILFRIAHFEGHPPLWHILLALPAKAGLPWQWALRGVGFLCMTLSAGLIIFKSPFPRWIKYSLPFTYFLFIQYGVIVRPYGLMVLVMILLALAFPTKDTRPGRFLGLLALLSACHLFGMALACGITLAWLWEIKNSRPWGTFLRGLLHDRRFHGMLVLLAWALLLVAGMWPAEHTAAYAEYEGSVLRTMLYVFLALPADAVLTNLHYTFFIREVTFDWLLLLRAAVIGLILWTCLLAFLPRKQWKYLLLPYLFLGGLFVCYCSRHHIGLAFVLAMWCVWITLQTPGYKPSFAWPKLARVAKAMLILALTVPLAWSAAHAYWDVRLTTFNGYETVRFLREHQLIDKRIFGEWRRYTKNGQLLRQNIHAQSWTVQLNLYTPYNIVANFHNGTNKTYNSFGQLVGDQDATLARWHSQPVPEVLLGSVPLPTIWPDRPDLWSEYVPVFEMKAYNLWKFDPPGDMYRPIYVHKSLLGTRDLPRIETHDWSIYDPSLPPIKHPV